MSIQRYTARESAETTSIERWSANAIASAVLPTPVGPTSAPILYWLLAAKIRAWMEAVPLDRKPAGRYWWNQATARVHASVAAALS